jgi:hypothetical protein
MGYEFDHLVITARDRMDQASALFNSFGFNLTPLSQHNLGSCNRLAILDNSYIELLGWEPGSPSVRKEIAEEPYGLNALVFRTANADISYESLKNLGFSPNPVQDLSRPVEIGKETKQAMFKAVRFANQPIPGIRLYFCEHLTPQYVWREEDMRHQNTLSTLKEIVLSSSEPRNVYLQLMKLLQEEAFQAPQDHDFEGEVFEIRLKNCRIKIVYAEGNHLTKISTCLIESSDGSKNLEIKEADF